MFKKKHIGKIINNEIVADRMMKSGQIMKAEKLLMENVKLGSTSHTTYDLLLEIYRKISSYADITRTLNAAIKNSARKKEIYREIKKVIILNRIIGDLRKK